MDTGARAGALTPCAVAARVVADSGLCVNAWLVSLVLRRTWRRPALDDEHVLFASRFVAALGDLHRDGAPVDDGFGVAEEKHRLLGFPTVK